MSTTLVVLLVLAGLSESAGQVLPLLARRQKLSLRLVASLVAIGTVVEGTVIALWPATAWIIAGLVQSVIAPAAVPLPAAVGLTWTTALIAPLLLAAILAFPLLGPFLHTLLVAGVGAGLAGPLAAASGLGWWTAAGCIAVAGMGLTVTIGVVRKMIARIIAGGRQWEATS